MLSGEPVSLLPNYFVVDHVLERKGKQINIKNRKIITHGVDPLCLLDRKIVSACLGIILAFLQRMYW